MDGADEKGIKPRILFNRQPQFLFLLCILASLEWFISGVVTLVIIHDPKNSLIFGFSVLRLLMVAGIWILAGIVLVAGVIARKKQVSLDSVGRFIQARNLRFPIYAISFALIVLGWLALFCPAYLFGKQIFIFERIQPFSVALGISLAQSWLLFLFTRDRLGFYAICKLAIKKYLRPTLLFAVILIGLGIFIAVSKFGLLANIDYAYVPGIPLTSLQLFFILLLVGLWFALVPGQEQGRPFIRIVKKYRLIPILIFLITVLVWELTPMLRHFFSLSPAAPSYQPFPFSDARLYDLGAISILRGYGISYLNNENPLYLIFLAILHFFAGYNYKLLTWLQVLILAFIPVILFLVGKKYHSAAFGIFLAFVLIVRQSNAMLLSYKVSSLNPKLFMTEEMALLGIVLFAYLVFLWMRERKIWLAFLCGGCIGATALFRLNTLVLFPAIACLIVPAFWKMGKKYVAKHLSAFTLAFLILLIPWIFSSVGPDGTPWLLFKIRLIKDQRYGSIAPSLKSLEGSNLSGMKMAAIPLEGNDLPNLQLSNIQGWVSTDYALAAPSQSIPRALLPSHNPPGGIVPRFLYHLLHNFSTSVMSLPDSLRYDDLDHLTQRVYWADRGGWQGNLPIGQIGLVILNLLLIAIGLGYGWVHHRWAGMIPLAIFIAYSVSLAAAMNSGGRYLPPMDWVFFFYYGLAIIAIIQFVLKVITGRGQSQPASPDLRAAQPASDRRNLVFSLAGIILLASLVPIANYVLPSVTASALQLKEMEAIGQSLSVHEKPGTSIVYGQILYPYADDNELNFDFLTPTGDTSYAIPRTPGLPGGLTGGEPAFIALQSDAQGNFTQLESIYQWQGTKALLIWKNQP